MRKVKKYITKKVEKKCGTPEDFCFEYVSGATVEEGYRRMKEYIRCVTKIRKTSSLKRK